MATKRTCKMTITRIVFTVLFLLITSVLDAQNSNEQILFNKHFDKKITAFAMSESGQFVVVATADGSLCLFDVFSGDPNNKGWLITQGQPITSLAISSNGRVICIANGKLLGVYQVGLNKSYRTYAFDELIKKVDMSNDGKSIAVLAWGVEIVDNTSSTSQLRLFKTVPQYRSSVTSIAIAPNGQSIAISYPFNIDISSISMQPEVVRTVPDKKSPSLRFEDRISSLSYSDNGVVAIGFDPRPSFEIWPLNGDDERRKKLLLSSLIKGTIPRGMGIGRLQLSDEFLLIESEPMTYVFDLVIGAIVPSNISGSQYRARQLALNGYLVGAIENEYTMVVAMTTQQTPLIKEIIRLHVKADKELLPLEILEQRDEALAKYSDPVKDEFETQSEFENRKKAYQKEVSNLQFVYLKRLIDSENQIKLERVSAQKELEEKLNQTGEPITAEVTLGLYDAESEQFPIQINGDEKQMFLSIPRDGARAFKADAAGMKAEGLRKLNSNLRWETVYSKVSNPSGLSYGILRKRDQLSTSQPSKFELEGSWSTITEGSQGRAEGKLTFNKDRSGYSGKVSGGRITQSVELSEVKLHDNDLTFKYTIPFGSSSLTIVAMVTIEGNSFSGTISFGEGRSTPIKGIKDPSSKSPDGPPSLTSTLKFEEPSGDNVLDAGEVAQIKVTISNSGVGDANGVNVTAKSISSQNILISQVYIDRIPAHQSRTGILEVHARDQLSDGVAEIQILYEEARGFPPDPAIVRFDTRAFLPPSIVISDVGVSEPGGNGLIDNGEIVEITARIQNIGKGKATNAKGRFDLGPNVFKTTDHSESFNIGNLPPGSYYDAEITIYVNKAAVEVPVFITINEGSGRYDLVRWRLDPNKLARNTRVQQLEQIVIAGKDKPLGEVALAGGLSVDIEQDVPTTKKRNPNAVALIIGIRDYASPEIPLVLFAKRDAQLVREYLIKSLGFDPRNILPQNPEELMTVGNMKNLLRQKLPAYLKPDGSSDVFVYYAGHGAPNTNSQQPFFVPYDTDPNYVNEDNAYPMSEFYMDLSKLKARRKMVVIDACFSGQTGDGRTIVKNASSVLLKVNNPLLIDKTATVFQSSESNQVSNWYPDKKHGMFTYFFLKGLKGAADADRNGIITIEELEGYINDDNQNLPYVSRREMQRQQRAVVYGDKTTVIADFR